MMPKDKACNQFILLLKISSITVLLGRAWQFLFLDAPYRTLLWDESLMKPIVQILFGMDWQTWTSEAVIDQNIQLSIRITGAIYLIGSVLVVFINKNRRWIAYFLWLCCFLLFVLACLQTKEKFYHLGQFFEHSSQVGVLAILIWSVKDSVNEKTLLFFIKLLVLLTFSCHGLYAINYYPRPGEFVDMMINTFGTSESFSHIFIFVVGILDILVAIALFIPRFNKVALWYTVIWGLITAFARVTANVYMEFFLQSLQQSLHLTLYRIVHGLLPLSLLVLQGWELPKFKKRPS